jgi:hypothetical protein
MATPKLPTTSIRLATSISLYCLREDSISLKTSFASIFSPRSTPVAIQKQMKLLKGIVSFSEDQSRDLEHRFEVDSNVLGNPLEVMASPVRHSIKMRRAVIYGDDLISTLGYGSDLNKAGTMDGGLLSQALTTPLILIKQERAPAGSGVSTVVTFYRNCLIGSITRSSDVSGGADLRIYEDATFFYADRQQFTS